MSNLYNLNVTTPSLGKLELGFRLTVTPVVDPGLQLQPVNCREFIFTTAFLHQIIRCLPATVTEVVLALDIHRRLPRETDDENIDVTIDMGWELLDTAFRPKYNAALKRVRIMKNVSRSRDGLQKWTEPLDTVNQVALMKHLPLLAARQIVSFI